MMFESALTVCCMSCGGSHMCGCAEKSRMYCRSDASTHPLPALFCRCRCRQRLPQLLKMTVVARARALMDWYAPNSRRVALSPSRCLCSFTYGALQDDRLGDLMDGFTDALREGRFDNAFDPNFKDA